RTACWSRHRCSGWDQKGSKRVRGRRKGSEANRNHLEIGHVAKVPLVIGAHQHAEIQVSGSRGNGEVVRRYQACALAELREQLGPVLGDESVEIDDSGDLHERVDPRSSSSGAHAIPRQGDAHEELALYGSRQRNGFTGVRAKRRWPVGTRPFERDERTGVDYEAHGFRGGRSAAPTRARSSANDVSW